MNRVYQLDLEVSREEFDRVFDAHWHNGFMIRHLIYKISRGEESKKKPTTTTGGKGGSKKKPLVPIPGKTSPIAKNMSTPKKSATRSSITSARNKNSS